MTRLLLLLVAFAGIVTLTACGSSGSSSSGVVIATVDPNAGGKPAAPVATAVKRPVTSDGAVAPTTGAWIDVDVTAYRVRLMDGTRVLETIEPVAVGAQVDTGAYESTQTGLFHVYNKIAGLQYDPPYNTYISDWVGFDPDKANGFHSFLKDVNGRVVDPGTGRISNGCIRTSASERIFAFAQVGMAVFVHA